MTSIDTYINAPTELKKAYHDVKNSLANLILLTEISDASTTNSLMPVVKTVNNELWKVVYKLDLLQLLTQPLSTNDGIKNNVRVDEVMDEVVERFCKTEPTFHITISLSETIEISQLLIVTDSDSLSRLLSFILAQLHASSPTTHWYIYISYVAQELKITFSKNNDPLILDTCEWLNSFNTYWEWLAIQKIAQQQKFELSVAYNNHHLSSIMLTQAL